MSFKYKFELNNVELEDVSIGASTIEKLEEPLDEGSIRLPFTVRNYEYEMLGYLKVTIGDTDLDELVLEFLVINDDVSEGSKYGDFIHELTLIEYTHKYDKYLVHSMAFTKPFKDNNPAKFLYNESVNYATSNYGYVYRAYIPPINIVSSYYSDETILLEQVSKGIQATFNAGTNVYEYAEVDVYLKINSTRFVLSGSGASISLSAGDYEFEYGFVAVGNDYSMATGDMWLYKYQVRIIDRENVSVKSILNILRDNVSKYGGIESKFYFDDTRLFNIDPAIDPYLESIEIPQIYIQKATLRQVLNTIFLYVNAISRAYNEGTIDKLSMDEFNKIVDDFDPQDIAGYHTSQESNGLGSKGVSWLERLLPDNRERANIVQPSGNQYQTVRSDNIQITQDKFGLELSRPLYEPKKFSFILDEFEIVDNVELTTVKQVDNYSVDLTPRFINKSEWSIKDQTTNFPTTALERMFEGEVGLRNNKTGNIFWVQNTNYIELSNIFGYVWQNTLIKNVIQEAFYEEITRNPHEPHIILGGEGVTDKMVISYAISIGGETESGYDSTTTFDLLDWRYYRFNLEYITQENSTIEVEREDLSYLDYYSELRQNQSDKLLNVELASRKSYGELQRSGVPNRTFQKFHTTIASLYSVGMQDSNGYVITKRKLELHNNYILATYNATKDHNRLSQYIGLQQAYRWSEIPQTSQIYERIEAYRDYVLIHEPSKTFGEELTKIYSTNTLKLLFGNLINDWQDTLTSGKTRVTSGFVVTDKFREIYTSPSYNYAISLPINAFGKKGGLVFQFGFSNNQIALSAVENISGNKYNKAVRYTDNLGRMNEMWFQLSRNYNLPNASTGWTDKETLDNYPLVRANQSNLIGDANETIFRSGILDPENIAHDPLIITKDKSQNIIIPYQLNVIPYDYKVYIIGQEFFNENFLVKNPYEDNGEVVGTKTYIYLYDTLTPYGIFDDLKIKSGYVSKIELVSDVNVQLVMSITGDRLEFLSPLITQVFSNANWAIGNDRGDLYLACNKPVNGFRMTKKHFRPELLEIGRVRDNVDIQILDFTLQGGFDLAYVRGTTLVDDIDVLLQGGFDLAYTRGTELLESLDTPLVGNLDMAHIRGSTVIEDLDTTLGTSFDLQYWRTIDIGGDLDTPLIANIDLVYQRGTELQESLDVALPTSFDLSYVVSTIGDGSILASVDGLMTANLELSYYRTTDIGGDLDIEGVANLDLEYWRTKDIGDNIDSSMIGNLDLVYQRGTTLLGNLDIVGTADLDLDYFITRNIDITFDSVLTTGFNLVYTAVEYQWLSGGTSPSGGTSCTLPNHVGNVRCDLLPATCNWETVGGLYTSSRNESDNVGSSCLIEGTKTECSLFGGTWYCQDYVADITSYEYGNCEICSEVAKT